MSENKNIDAIVAFVGKHGEERTLKLLNKADQLIEKHGEEKNPGTTYRGRPKGKTEKSCKRHGKPL